MRTVAVIVAMTSLTLISCGGGGGGGGSDDEVDNGICRAIADMGATTSSTLAPNATLSNESSVFDGNLRSAATLSTTGGVGTSSVRGTLNIGSEPGGVGAGILFKGNVNSNTGVTIATFLDDNPQDAGPAVNTILTEDSTNYFGIHTTKDFDSIQVTFSLNGEAPILTLLELCVR